MELLDIDSDSLLEMSTDGSSIILSPVKDRERLNRLKASLDKINSKHSATLKKLAK